jgi:hypothetical protein
MIAVALCPACERPTDDEENPRADMPVWHAGVAATRRIFESAGLVYDIGPRGGCRACVGRELFKLALWTMQRTDVDDPEAVKLEAEDVIHYLAEAMGMTATLTETD